MSRSIGGGRFELVQRLGSGGMGVVHEAIDRERDIRVAVKELRRFDPQALYRFKKEFRALADVSHPNLVRFIELFEDAGSWFFTMELVRGEDLVSWCRPGKTLELARVEPAFVQLASALASLHTAEMVHRDLKPANVIVTDTGRVVLVDLGLVLDVRGARAMSERLLVGTANYMAPEQAASLPVGPPADCYSFGIMLYQVLTGRVPFSGNLLEVMRDKQTKQVTPAVELAPKSPAELSSLCDALLQFKPEMRPDAREIIERLGGNSSTSTNASLSGEQQPIIGRTAELAELGECFSKLAGGDCVVAYVIGESGSGKSALLRRFAEDLRHRDPTALVLRGRCYERESVPYKAIDGVVDMLSRHLQRIGDGMVAELLPQDAELLPLVFPVLGRVTALRRAANRSRVARDPSALRARVFDAMRCLFTEIAARRSVILIVDDFQWADADSTHLLREIFRSPDAPAVMLLVSSQRAPEGHERIGDPLRIVQVGSLDSSEANELAVELLRRAGMGTAGASAIAMESRGQPLFIDELVRHVAVAGQAGVGEMRLDDAICARIESMPEPAIRVLRATCIAAAPLEREVIQVAADVTPDEMDRALSQLRVARLVRAPSANMLEPYHNRIRSALLKTICADDLRALHGKVAGALEGSSVVDDHPELLVEHLVAAGSNDVAAGYAHKAAKRASDVFAFERAAGLYRLALNAGRFDAEGRRTLQIALADALAFAGQGSDAAPLYLAAAKDADLSVSVECQRRAARHLLLNGHVEPGLEALGQILASHGLALPESPRRALASLLWQRLRLRARGLRWKPRHPREIAEVELARVDVLLDVGESFGMFDSIRGADFSVRGLMRALELGERSRIGRALAVEAIYRASVGRRGEVAARRLLRTTEEIAGVETDPFLDALVRTADGVICYLVGQLDEAVVRFDDVGERFRELGSTWELNNARLFRAFSARWTGGFAARYADRNATIRDASRRGDLYTETAMRLTRNLELIAIGRPDDAEIDLAVDAWHPPAGSFHLQQWWELEARAELAMYRGDVAAACEELTPRFAEVEKSLFMRIQFVRANTRWTRARLCIALASERDDGPMRCQADQLAKKLRREKVAYAAVWAGFLDMARLSSSKPEQAARLAAELAPIADGCGMPLLGQVARWREGELSGDGAKLAAAEQWLRAEGVAEPERFVGVFSPGVRCSL